MTKYNKDDFHKSTFAEFKVAHMPSREPDFISESGSKYWYTYKGVYRHSDHWGEVRSCVWEYPEIVGLYNVRGCFYEKKWDDTNPIFLCGFCEFENFYEIKEYWIGTNGQYCAYQQAMRGRFNREVKYEFLPQEYIEKEILAAEFGAAQFCYIPKDVKKRNRCLTAHPNHYTSNTLRIIDYPYETHN